MVVINDVGKKFGGKTVLEGVSLNISPGEVFGLLGPNGAGKTTLIRILTGVLPPSFGFANINQIDVGTHPEQIKAIIGYATQEASVYRDLSVRENLEFRAKLFLQTSTKEVVSQVIDRFGLSEYENTLAGSLSGGWRQRLAIAQAVVHRPKVLFLDEPTTGLDPTSRRIIWNLIHEEAKTGTTVLVTTHYMDEAERCHRLSLLFEGRLVITGTPHQLRQKALEQSSVSFAKTTLSLDEIRNFPGVIDCWPSGDGFRVLQEKGSSAANLELSATEPNLEDVFIVLTRPQKLVTAGGAK